MKKFFKENRKGFTLIELLVVISILAVLATLYVPKIISGTTNAKETVAIADARTLASEITQLNAYALASGESVFTAAVASDNLLPSAIDGTTRSSESAITNTKGKFVLTKARLSGATKDEYKNLLNGRNFPDADVVLIIVDNTGSAYILDAKTGEAFK